MTSWQQYFKNMSMEFIVLVVMFYDTVISEIQKGTLINMFTKGLSRLKVLGKDTCSCSSLELLLLDVQEKSINLQNGIC